ncbi:MAG: class I SAM-dependent methyltransferase [Prolixibacteraceae bacterium]|nr:class I SAM-dependent methyltransferase [Prolixibacteraceae bacterium]
MTILKCTNYLHCHQDHQNIYSTSENLQFIECSDCGLIWRSPESMDIKKEYDKTYIKSNKYLKNRQHKIKKASWILQIALGLNPDLKSLLEIGSSIGSTLEAAKNTGLEHLGIDINEYAIEYCKNNGLNAENKTLEELIAEYQRFDIIFMQHVLEHFEDPFLVLDQCKQLLNDGGLVVILVPNSNYRSARKNREKHRFYNINGVGKEHYVYFNYTSLSKLLESQGYEVIQQNYPVWMKGSHSVEFFLNRLVRSSLSLIDADQEILVFAKIDKNPDKSL